MNNLDRLTLVFYGFLALIIGLFAIWVQTDSFPYRDTYNAIVGVFQAKPVFINLIWGVLALIGFSLLNIGAIRRKEGKAVLFKTKHGQVRIVLSAIEDYIKRHVLDMDEVKDVAIRVDLKGKGLKIKSKIVLNSEDNITNVADTVQGHIKQETLGMLGLEVPLFINVNITKMVTPSKSKKDKKVDDDKKDESISFEGIKY